MKQHVYDINDTLSGLLSELQQLQRTVNSQHAEICSLNRNVFGLLKENRGLRRRLSKYEEPPGNSNNGYYNTVCQRNKKYENRPGLVSEYSKESIMFENQKLIDV